MPDAVIVVDRTAYLVMSGLATMLWLLFIALFWAACSPTRDMKIALAATAAFLVGGTWWSFAVFL